MHFNVLAVCHSVRRAALQLFCSHFRLLGVLLTRAEHGACRACYHACVSQCTDVTQAMSAAAAAAAKMLITGHCAAPLQCAAAAAAVFKAYAL